MGSGTKRTIIKTGGVAGAAERKGVKMQVINAEQFRQKLAGLESPETRFNDAEIVVMKATGVEMIKALRNVFGPSLDRKTVWERISNGITIAAAKSGGKGDKFLSGMLDYVKSEANSVVGSDALKNVMEKIISMTIESQRQFIRICVEYRMLLCLQARDEVETEKRTIQDIKNQTGAAAVQFNDDGTIQTAGEVRA
jgi:hypothetical protein